MVNIKGMAPVACAVSILAAATQSRAQIAVIDGAAIAHIVQQVQATQQVLSNARNQLQQAQQALQTMTGNRGMQLLLSGVVRNYLPASWSQLAGTNQSLGASYPALAGSVASLVSGNSVLSPQALAALSPADQQRIANARTLAATNQAVSRSSLSNASGRFTDLQSLINSIGSTSDQKGILELQTRIVAELGMLQNEQTKLLSLFQALHAEEAAAREQQQEQVVAGHGQFASRFQPAP
jgi:hypothetical protein